MTEEARQRTAPCDFWIGVDSIDRHRMEGKVFSLYPGKEAYAFHGMPQLLQIIDDLAGNTTSDPDVSAAPVEEPFRMPPDRAADKGALRTLRAPAAPVEGRAAAWEEPRLLRDATVLSGHTATFHVRVLYWQNCSAQGSVHWLEGRARRHFRSELELMRLMDSALWIVVG